MFGKARKSTSQATALSSASLRGVWAAMLALALVLSGLGGTVVAAAEAEHADGVITTVQETVFSGMLPASTGAGTFALYELAYAGGKQVTVTVTPVFADFTQSAGFGLKLYGDGGLLAKGATRNDGARLEVSYIGDAADTLTVQVYNYTNQPVSYSLQAVGVDAITPMTAEVAAVAPAAEPEGVVSAEEPQAGAAALEPTAIETPEAAAPTTTEVEGEALSPLVLDVTGSLVGDVGGAYATYELTIPADAAPLSVSFTPSAVDPSFGDAVGFEIYGPYGRVAGGVRNDAGVHTASLLGAAGNVYTIQVYNYAPGQSVNYSLKVSR